MSRMSVPQLYRHILRAAKRFPSIKRDSVVEEIRIEFAANKHLTDKKVVQEKRALAESSLRQLEEYVGISRDDSTQAAIHLKGPLNV